MFVVCTLIHLCCHCCCCWWWWFFCWCCCTPSSLPIVLFFKCFSVHLHCVYCFIVSSPDFSFYFVLLNRTFSFFLAFEIHYVLEIDVHAWQSKKTIEEIETKKWPFSRKICYAQMHDHHRLDHIAHRCTILRMVVKYSVEKWNGKNIIKQRQSSTETQCQEKWENSIDFLLCWQFRITQMVWPPSRCNNANVLFESK